MELDYFTVEQLNKVESRKRERRGEERAEIREYLSDLKTMLQREHPALRSTENTAMASLLLELESLGVKRHEEIERRKYGT